MTVSQHLAACQLQMYGTKLETIRAIHRLGKMAILDVEPQVGDSSTPALMHDLSYRRSKSFELPSTRRLLSSLALLICMVFKM